MTRTKIERKPSDTSGTGGQDGTGAVPPNQALVGLQLGFLPYRLREDIVGLAERSIYPTSRPPAFEDELTEIRALIESVSLPKHSQAWRDRAVGIVDGVQDALKNACFMQDCDAERLRFNATAKDAAENHAWSSSHPYLPTYMAVRPHLAGRTWVDRFDGHTKDVPTQWDVASFWASWSFRASVVDLSKVPDLSRPIKEIAEGAGAELLRWFKIGDLLGRVWWACWCPVPAQFKNFVPRDLAALMRLCPKLKLPDTGILRDRWQRLNEHLSRSHGRCPVGQVLPVAPGVVPDGAQNNAEPEPEVAWSDWLARLALKMYSRLKKEARSTPAMLVSGKAGRRAGSGDTDAKADRKTAEKWRHWCEDQWKRGNHVASFDEYARLKGLDANAVKAAVGRDRKR